MSAVEVYNPEPTSLVAVADQCDQIETWAAQCESVPELKDWQNKLAAINEYLVRTSTQGRARVEATLRRLEVRIGELLPKDQGRRSDLLPDRNPEVRIDDHTKADFRAMAANKDVVEEQIAKSTDAEPASRAKVTGAIKAKKQAEGRAQFRQELQEQAEWMADLSRDTPPEIKEHNRVDSEAWTAAGELERAIEMVVSVANPTRFAEAFWHSTLPGVSTHGVRNSLLAALNQLDPYMEAVREHR